MGHKKSYISQKLHLPLSASSRQTVLSCFMCLNSIKAALIMKRGEGLKLTQVVSQGSVLFMLFGFNYPYWSWFPLALQWLNFHATILNCT